MAVRKKEYRIHIDCFSALDDLPKREHNNPAAVIALLKKERRFSCFEMQDNLTLWRTIKNLEANGTIAFRDVGYPWRGVVVLKELP